MKTKKALAFKLLMLVLSCSAFGQNTSWSWAIQSEGNGSEGLFINRIEEDSDGNFIFLGTFDADMSFGGQMIEYTGGLFSPFIAKISPQGELLWLKAIGSPDVFITLVQDFAIDSSDNIYFTLSLFGPVSLDLGNGIIIELLENQNGTFIIRLNADGEAQWARNYNDNSSGGTILNSQIEIFEDTILFGGGFINDLMIDEFTLIPLPGNGDAFLCKLDLQGNAHWATSLGGYAGEQNLDFEVSNQGDIYTALSWTGDTLFAQDQYLVNDMPTFLPFGGNSDRAIIKFNRNGVVQWMRSESSDEPEEVGRILPCNDGGVLISSTTLDGITINGEVLPPGSTAMVKYSSSGSVEFITSFLNNESYFQPILTEDEQNNFYLIFSFIEDQIQVGEFTLSNSVSGSGTADIGMAQLNSSGDIVWANSFGSSDNDGPSFIHSNSDGSYLLGGNYAGESLSLGDNLLENSGEFTNNLFIAKFDILSGIGQILENSVVNIFPNPGNETISADLTGFSGNKIKVKILNIQGQIISEEMWDKSSGAYRKNCNDLDSGVYFMEFCGETSISISRFVVQH